MRNKHMEPVFYTAYGQILESSILHGFERWVGKFIEEKSITSHFFNQSDIYLKIMKGSESIFEKIHTWLYCFVLLQAAAFGHIFISFTVFYEILKNIMNVSNVIIIF